MEEIGFICANFNELERVLIRLDGYIDEHEKRECLNQIRACKDAYVMAVEGRESADKQCKEIAENQQLCRGLTKRIKASFENRIKLFEEMNKELQLLLDTF